MNNDELNKILKSAHPPERPDEYWREFPKKVTAKLHWQEQLSARPARRTHKLVPMLAWGLSVATVCVLMAFVLNNKPGTEHHVAAVPPASDVQFDIARKCYKEIEALFPNQLQAIVFDQQGPRMMLSAKGDVANAAPLYLKICGPKGCESFVTFSGQQIQFNGENCEVLADAKGQVMLVGDHQVWEGTDSSSGIRIEAKPLDAIL